MLPSAEPFLPRGLNSLPRPIRFRPPREPGISPAPIFGSTFLDYLPQRNRRSDAPTLRRSDAPTLERAVRVAIPDAFSGVVFTRQKCVPCRRRGVKHSFRLGFRVRPGRMGANENGPAGERFLWRRMADAGIGAAHQRRGTFRGCAIFLSPNAKSYART